MSRSGNPAPRIDSLVVTRKMGPALLPTPLSPACPLADEVSFARRYRSARIAVGRLTSSPMAGCQSGWPDHGDRTDSAISVCDRPSEQRLWPSGQSSELLLWRGRVAECASQVIVRRGLLIRTLGRSFRNRPVSPIDGAKMTRMAESPQAAQGEVFHSAQKPRWTMVEKPTPQRCDEPKAVFSRADRAVQATAGAARSA